MNRQETRKSAVVRTSGAEPDAKEDLTERVLMSLVFDVTCLAQNVEQIKVKVFALAREHGIRTDE